MHEPDHGSSSIFSSRFSARVVLKTAHFQDLPMVLVASAGVSLLIFTKSIILRMKLNDIWGFYTDADGLNTFQKWGVYDGQAIDVTWDDAAVANAGLVRPALGG